ncbi:Enoyl-CoA delta isomerase 1, peroxisomal [Smittium mucronatum]|uniref:Enoyl-CoA delta isomerase 1, peroxisomal n=1 Tax=Smittium mucronatum TaxID=133383 RepID=A0A1R0H2I5_9FUNG|nr:Enoyl-CoA delta isomerase 1, peroxisomal [Smittium mucronatum]
MMTFRLPTIAAVNGHAFAGGCMLASMHDYVVMGTDKGFICMNEIDIDFPLDFGTFEFMRTRLNSPKNVHLCLVEGKRFTASEAVRAGLVDIAVPNSQVFKVARELGNLKSKLTIKNAGRTYGLMKAEKNRRAVEAMLDLRMKPGEYLAKL